MKSKHYDYALRNLIWGIFVLLLSFTNVFAQTKNVSGRVTTADSQEGLPGVSISIQGTKVGTTSDGNGKYSLSVTGTNAVIVFSSVGYITEQRTVGNQQQIDVSLVADTKQ